MDDLSAIRIPGLILSSDVREGGQAIVIRGTTTDGRAVGAKISRYEKWARASIERELEALLRIHEADADSSRWLVDVVDHGTLEDGRPFVVLPWFPHSLLTWLTVEDPGLGLRFDALVQACAAVARLHSSGALHEVTVHRDLKPGNFLIRTSPKMEVRLADLGGVKARSFRERTSNTVMFTPTYAPLEQRLPMERPLDSSVDIHALGVMVFQVLTGELPSTSLQRSAYRLPACSEFQALADSREALPPEKEARFQQLARSPLSTFYRLDEAPDLVEEDREMLEKALKRTMADASVEEVMDLLVPALERSLRADPDRRESSARELLAACVRGRELAGLTDNSVMLKLVGPLLREVPPAEEPQEPPPRGRKRLLFGVVAASMLCGAALAWAAFNRLSEPGVTLSVEKAHELGIEDQLTPPEMTLRFESDAEAHMRVGTTLINRSTVRGHQLVRGSNSVEFVSRSGTVLGRFTLVVDRTKLGWQVKLEEDEGHDVVPDGLSWKLKPGNVLMLKVKKRGGKGVLETTGSVRAGGSAGR